MSTTRWWLVSLSLMLLLLGSVSPVLLYADAIVVTRAMKATTIAEVFVRSDSVLVELEIGVANLAAFHNLMPDEIYEEMTGESEALAQRLPRFLQDDFIIQTEDGTTLDGWLLSLQVRRRIPRDTITGKPLPVPEGEEELIVFALLGYALPGRPASLSITPPLGQGTGLARADIGFVLYHEGLPVTDFRYLGATETVDLDWDDPWYSHFRNRNLRRQYDAPLNVFLYVEPYEVRVEIIARPADLQQWVDLGLVGNDTIPAGVQTELLEKTGTFLAEHMQLTVDGQAVSPTLDRIHFLHRTLRNSTVIDPPVHLAKVSATLGAIYVQPTAGLPETAAVAWDLFPPRAQFVYAAATDQAGPMPSRLSPEDPVLVWQNFLTNPDLPTLVEIPAPPTMGRIRLPVVSLIWALILGAPIVHSLSRTGPRPRWLPVAAVLLLAGFVLMVPLARISVPFPLTRSTPVQDIDTPGVVSGLLTNVYRAFDQRDENAIYDTLARSASGDLLTRIYLETKQSLELQNQGGARVKVKEVSLQEVAAESLGGEAGFRATCQWNVAGSVGHWGHVHTRTNRYEAVLIIRPVAGAWKITELELVQEERVS